MVLRWVEDSQLEFVPEGKRPGTKSYDRYCKYSQGKNVGEVLELSAKPEDLLNDYEKGLIKYVGGPIRDVPLDLDKIEDTSSLTKTDLTLARWNYRCGQAACTEGPEAVDKKIILAAHKTAAHKKLRKAKKAKKFNVSMQDVVDANWCESAEMAIWRAKANKQAANILEQVKTEGRKVTSEDVLSVLQLWRWRENTTRLNVMPEGVTSVHSDNMGLLKARDGRYMLTKETEEYPNVVHVFSQWLKDNQPKHGFNFPFTSISVNASYGAKLHRDRNNFGPSMIGAFGEFTGGKLEIWPEDDQSCKLEELRQEDKIVLDVHNKALVFDGNRAHAVQTFEGERYSLVFFTAAKYWKTPQEVQEQLVAAGVNFPSEKTAGEARKILPPPKGYGIGSACHRDHGKHTRRSLLASAKAGTGNKTIASWLMPRRAIQKSKESSTDDANTDTGSIKQPATPKRKRGHKLQGSPSSQPKKLQSKRIIDTLAASKGDEAHWTKTNIEPPAEPSAKKARLVGSEALSAECGMRLLESGLKALREAAASAQGGERTIAEELRPQLMQHLLQVTQLAACF